jgi:hypothetical protein
MGKKYLKLYSEQKLARLLKNVKDKESLEASGVVVRAKDILVVMDCMKGIGRLRGQNKKDPLGKGKIVGPQQSFEKKADAEALRLVRGALKNYPHMLTYRYIEQLSPERAVMIIKNGKSSVVLR